MTVNGVPLILFDEGVGSRPEIVAYVREVIEQRTTPGDDTTADRLARGIVTSVLSRLGASLSVAAGESDRPVLREEDLRVDVFTNGTPECSVRIHHLPTHCVAEATGRGQLRVKAEALATLRQKVADAAELPPSAHGVPGEDGSP
jgi:hypothetical protein